MSLADMKDKVIVYPKIKTFIIYSLFTYYFPCNESEWELKIKNKKKES